MLICEGFVRGMPSACVFAHQRRCISVSVHADDSTATSPKDQLDWFAATLKRHYELTVRGRLGPGPADDKGARVFNCIIRWRGLRVRGRPEGGREAP